MVQFIRDSSFV